jgi:vacuolar-type H+-ATPase catalytic subunit A/Vma1
MRGVLSTPQLKFPIVHPSLEEKSFHPFFREGLTPPLQTSIANPTNWRFSPGTQKLGGLSVGGDLLGENRGVGNKKIAIESNFISIFQR